MSNGIFYYILRRKGGKYTRCNHKVTRILNYRWLNKLDFFLKMLIYRFLTYVDICSRFDSRRSYSGFDVLGEILLLT